MPYLIKSYLRKLPSLRVRHQRLIHFAIAIKWLTQKSPDLNPDCLGKFKLLSLKKVKNSLKIRRSKILLQIGSKGKGP